MAIKIAINGFGRIGRMVLRAIAERNISDIQVVAINDLGTLSDNAHLFKYDSIHGRFLGNVQTQDNYLDVGLGAIQVLSQADPSKLPWKDLDIDLVLECSGHFTDKASAQKHLEAGAKKVLISAPAENADFTVVYGVNHQQLTNQYKIISNASCTTNCLAPVVDVLLNNCGIVHGYMTTIHAYTGDQRLIDTLHKDLRRARAAGLSMIPSSTGAAKAVGLVFPQLKGKIDGTAIRVPTANVSVVDLTFVAEKDITIEEINQAMIGAANQQFKNILEIVSIPLVSADFNHCPASASFDTTQTQVIDKRFGRVLAWYDNEWGFANRMCDVSLYLDTLKK